MSAGMPAKRYDLFAFLRAVSERQFAEVIRAGKGKTGHNYHCPNVSAHNNGDANPSLSIDNKRGPTLGHCHGCGLSGDLPAFAAQLWGVTDAEAARIAAERLGIPVSRPDLDKHYIYEDKSGQPALRVTRKPGKKFLQAARTGSDWDYKARKPKLLYRLPELMKADPSRLVFIVEGEKDADNLAAQGLVATTNPGGAGKWLDKYTEALQGRSVAILPDNDDKGRRHALQVARSCLRVAKETRIVVELPDLPEKGDISDWLESGGTAEKLERLTLEAQVLDMELLDQLEAVWFPRVEVLEPEPPEPEWPELDLAAYQGLAGDLVRAIKPHTEADPVAVLLQLLAAFGNAIGRSAHWTVEADEHYLNLYVAIVGESSKSRKGTSWGYIRKLLEPIDEDWTRRRIKGGLSTGEGLIWAVRDPIEETKPVKKNGRHTGEYETTTTDQGEADKRLMVIEPELARVLKVSARDTNTLSAVLREAWDQGNLSTVTKNSPACATGAHISLVGHITRNELIRHLDQTEAANGFANRFIWACVRRSKLLPEGGSFDARKHTGLISRLESAVCFGRHAGELLKDDKARAVWRGVYGDLSEGKPGLLGAITGRAEAQAMRLAALYAVMDQSPVIAVEHLRAGLALWQYAEDSARFIFGDTLGDPLADELYQALKESPEGMTRTEISNHFRRHKSADQIGRALHSLAQAGKVEEKTIEGPGRHADKYFVSGAKKAN